jgi:hypothetical protein
MYIKTKANRAVVSNYSPIDEPVKANAEKAVTMWFDRP